jgi:CRISPR-associated protein Cas1
MKKLLNTLFVTTQGSYLARDGESIIVRVEGETRLRLPVHTLDGVVCFGLVSCSPPMMELCAENGVLISFLSERGRFLARVQGRVSGNVLLRREQYRCADDERRTVEMAKAIVLAKVANCRTVMKRALRDHASKTNEAALNTAVSEMDRIVKSLVFADSLETIRGYEGEAARKYFSVFDHMIVNQKDAFIFKARSRRPPLDNVNALLSFIYTLLVHDITSALETVGLDPSVGFLHRDRPGRPGLALDILEEFRAFVADRLVLTLINRKQVTGKSFSVTECGGVMMSDEARKNVLTAYQKRKQEEMQHPFLKDKMKVGLLPVSQAMLMSAYFRKDLEAYPPVVFR